jgi:hypothetical protein
VVDRETAFALARLSFDRRFWALALALARLTFVTNLRESGWIFGGKKLAVRAPTPFLRLI